MYTLKTSDGRHRVLGQSNGNRQDEADGTFWVTTWPQQTRNAVEVGMNYLLTLPNNSTQPVELVQIGGAGMGGLRFEYTG